MRILVTGSAGFIGAALCLRLLERGDEVIGVDNINDYYDPDLKLARLDRFKDDPNFTDVRMDIADREGLMRVFSEYEPQRVVNMAAQAGVRYSLENPAAYIDTNLVGFGNILEGCRHARSRASGICLQQLGVRRQQGHAVLGAPQCRPSHEHVCGHQEGE